MAIFGWNTQAVDSSPQPEGGYFISSYWKLITTFAFGIFAIYCLITCTRPQGRRRVYYVNGVWNDFGQATATANYIGQKVLGWRTVTPIYNNATSPSFISRAVGFVFWSAIVVGTVCYGGAATARACSFILDPLTVGGVCVQRARVKHAADNVANRITQELNNDKSSDITIIAHSQGGLVTKKALKKISKRLKDRIKVITIGGLGTTHLGRNFLFKRDRVINAAKFARWADHNPNPEILKSDSWWQLMRSHEATTYLDHPTVSTAIRTACA